MRVILIIYNSNYLLDCCIRVIAVLGHLFDFSLLILRNKTYAMLPELVY